MSTAAVYVVRPAGARYEGLALLLVAAIVIALLTGYLYVNARKESRAPMYDWQISAFDKLTGADQAIYNALYTARDDIPGIYDDLNVNNAPGVKFRWPSPKDLEEVELPPFFKDRSWEQNGSLKWTFFQPLAEGEMQGSTMYLGTDGTIPEQGSFLLVVGHVHAGFTNNNVITIWWKKVSHTDLPRSGFQDGLILAGWREVVPYSGAQEVKRIFGNSDDNDPRRPGSSDSNNADDLANKMFGK